MDFQVYLAALAVILGVSVAAWMLSVAIKNVSFVDSLWSLFFLLAAVTYASAADPLGMRGMIVLACVVVWALRLSIYITARNWGESEDYRYQKIRANNEPFWIKSLYVVFGLQGLLAWVISVPLLAAIGHPAHGLAQEIGFIDGIAVLLFAIGLVFEAFGDYQLARFKRDPKNRGKVLNTGLWRYTRHPNYFGDFCIWWAFYLFALAAGGWWTIYAPLLMSFLLLKVSGVAMLERTIKDRRPKYAEYIEKTNAFFPGFPRQTKTADEAQA